MANVVETVPPMVGDAVIGVGKGEGFEPGPGLMMIVEKLPWANTLDVTRGVEEAIESLKPGLPGLEIDTTIFRPASFIETSLKNLSNSLLIGCLLMIFMLFIFLYSWRVALISVVAIPLSLLAAAMVLNWRGTTVNTMILAGFAIALGDVVDDAIIDIENVVRRLREHRREGRTGSTAGVILNASMEVRGAIVYATLIEVVAVIPIFFLEGLSGAFFRPLVTSYAIALLVSMAVALTVTPALALIFLHRAPLEKKESPHRRVDAAGLRLGPGPDHAEGPVRLRLGGRPRADRPVGGAEPRPVAPARLQGARLPDALPHQAGHVARRGGPHHRRRRPRSSPPSPGSATSAPTSARPTSRTSRWGRSSARTGSASTPRSTTTRRSTRSRRSWTTTRA